MQSTQRTQTQIHTLITSLWDGFLETRLGMKQFFYCQNANGKQNESATLVKPGPGKTPFITLKTYLKTKCSQGNRDRVLHPNLSKCGFEVVGTHIKHTFICSCLKTVHWSHCWLCKHTHTSRDQEFSFYLCLRVLFGFQMCLMWNFLACFKH